MKHFLFLLGVLACGWIMLSAAHAEDIKWNAPRAALIPPNKLASNLLPMYGTADGRMKTSDMLDADRKYMDEVFAWGYTRESGARRAIDLAWKYFMKGDTGTAMMRFNQAWLLDPENSESYHGFAILLADQNRSQEEVVKYFELARSKPGTTPGTYVDYGRYLWMQKQPLEAIAMLQQARALNPRARNVARHLAFIYAQQGNRTEACHWGKIAIESQDDLPPDQEFMDMVCK